MDNPVFNYRFFCKLLCISANQAVFEEAYKTQEIINSISDLMRYTQDTRRTIVSLDEEYKAIRNYIDMQNLRGLTMHISMENSMDSSQDSYINHLSLFSCIVEDIEKALDLMEDGTEVAYYMESGAGGIILKKRINGAETEVANTKRM